MRRRTLGLIPTNRGLGFAVLEDGVLLDYGVKRVTGNQVATALAKVQRLVARYAPHRVATSVVSGSKRRTRVRALLARIVLVVRGNRVAVRALAWPRVMKHLGCEEGTKIAVAQAVAQVFPQLARHVPSRRKIWEGEATRLAMLSAVAFAIVAETVSPRPKERAA